MERNIGDQLNKAFEAYRQVSIEKDNAKKQLQQMTEYYEQYTQKLQKQIDDQQQLISMLEAQLSATRKQAGEMKCEPCNHLVDGGSFRKNQFLENAGSVAAVHSSVDYQEMLDAFEAIQGKFRQIRSLTRKQKDHLKRFHGGNEAANDQRFSMPIQCTDRTAEAETPFSSALRSSDVPLSSSPPPPPTPSSSLASRGASPEDRDLVESLVKLSVKFPPPADSEYDFLNSTPERPLALAVKRPAPPPLGDVTAAAAAAVTTETEGNMATAFVYPTFSAHGAASPLTQEGVRGPQQPLWSPDLCDGVHVSSDPAPPPISSSISSISSSSINSPDKCAFCHAAVPQDQMNGHLYSHFSAKNEADD